MRQLSHRSNLQSKASPRITLTSHSLLKFVNSILVRAWKLHKERGRGKLFHKEKIRLVDIKWGPKLSPQ